MAALLERRLGLEVKLVKGARGAFEILDGDQLLFSKLAEGRFPEESEALELLGD